MDILRAATDWARAEMLSNSVFILCGALFLAVGCAFWHMGRADMVRAYVVPMVVAGLLLLILGGGLLYGTRQSLSGFAPDFGQDAAGFVAREMARVDKTIAQYRRAAFTVMPLLIAGAAGLMIVLNGPLWRAGLITGIAVLSIVMLVDSTACARLESYRLHLMAAAPG